MNTLLGRNSSDKGEKWNRIIKFFEVEIFRLDFFLRSEVIWSSLVELLDSITNWDTIREGKSFRFLMEQVLERGSGEKFLLVRFTNGGPLVTIRKRAFTWVDHVALITKPLSREPVNSIKISVVVARMDSAFVCLL